MDDDIILIAKEGVTKEIEKLKNIRTQDKDYTIKLKDTIGGLQNMVQELTAYSLASMPNPEEIQDSWGRKEAERIRRGMEKLTREMQEAYVCLQGFDKEVDKIQEYIDKKRRKEIRKEDERVNG